LPKYSMAESAADPITPLKWEHCFWSSLANLDAASLFALSFYIVTIISHSSHVKITLDTLCRTRQLRQFRLVLRQLRLVFRSFWLHCALELLYRRFSLRTSLLPLSYLLLQVRILLLDLLALPLHSVEMVVLIEDVLYDHICHLVRRI
jgi:hypothetical protein